jgi:uncharacterized MAPEG superfamily protein
MAPVAIVTLLLVLEYMIFGMLVGLARGKRGVEAPAISGEPVFDRTFRAHQNTAEQLWVTLPSMWIFAQYLSANIAAGLGVLFLIGRALYVRGYIQAAEKRSVGFLVGFLANVILLLGALFGAVRAALA